MPYGIDQRVGSLAHLKASNSPHLSKSPKCFVQAATIDRTLQYLNYLRTLTIIYKLANACQVHLLRSKMQPRGVNYQLKLFVFPPWEKGEKATLGCVLDIHFFVVAWAWDSQPHHSIIQDGCRHPHANHYW